MWLGSRLSHDGHSPCVFQRVWHRLQDGRWDCFQGTSRRAHFLPFPRGADLPPALPRTPSWENRKHNQFKSKHLWMMKRNTADGNMTAPPSALVQKERAAFPAALLSF